MKKEYENIAVYWDEKNEVPLILNKERDNEVIKNNSYKYIGTDFRPVFLEEKWLLLNLFPDKLSENILESSVWVSKMGKYVVNGKIINISTIKRGNEIDINSIREKILSKVFSKELIKKEEKEFQKFVKFNFNRFEYLTKNNDIDGEGEFIGAYPFIREVANRYSGRLMLVSFSGGKDSTVTSHLVRKALNNQEVLHIYGDTTLELPKSYEYVEKFKNENVYVPFFEEKNEESNFFEICKEVGPPSRVKTWCCSIFKTGPMGTTLSNFDENLITFLGVRRPESSSRAKYKKVSQSPKILKQMVACPVIDWLDIDIWLYIFAEKLDFNESYRQGFSRVGCWVCPNNGEWSQLLSSIYNAKEYDIWYDFLIDFAKKIGKEDYDVYVKTGKWKARHGGEGLDKSKEILLESKECVNEKNAKTYTLTKPIIEDFYELFKPFGDLKIIKKLGITEIIVLNKEKNPIFKINTRENSSEIKVALIDTKDRYLMNKVERQLNKYTSCLYCQACNSSCPTGALIVSNNRYVIDNKKCINCLKCIDKFDLGCLIASALKIKKGAN